MKGSFERIGLSPKVLSYSSASTSTLNVVRVQAVAGASILIELRVLFYEP